MITSIQNLFSSHPQLLQEKIGGALTDSQKKIAVFAAACFAFILASLALFKWSLGDRKIKADSLDQKPALNEEETSKTESNLIPLIREFENVNDRDICERLFKKLYDKKYFDIEDSLKRFSQLTKDSGLDVVINKDPLIRGRVDIPIEGGCLFFINWGCIGLPFPQLYFTSQFLATFETLSAKANKDPAASQKLKDHLQLVVKEIERTLEHFEKQDQCCN